MNSPFTGVIHNWGGEAPPRTMGVAGTIRVGERRMSKSGKEIPVSLDYFRCTGSYTNLFRAAFGDKPKSIPIVFSTSNRLAVMNERLEVRRGKSLYAKTDGRTIQYWDTKENDWAFLECQDPQQFEGECRRLELEAGSLFQHVLTLSFRIFHPQMTSMEWRLHTKGVMTSIKELRDPFELFLERIGTVQNVLFYLSVQMHVADNPSKSRYPIIRLLPAFSQAEMQYFEMNKDDVYEYAGPHRVITPKLLHEHAAQSDQSLLPNETRGEGVDNPHEDDLPVIQVARTEKIEPISSMRRAQELIELVTSPEKMIEVWMAIVPAYQTNLLGGLAIEKLTELWGHSSKSTEVKQRFTLAREKIENTYEEGK